WTTGPLPPGASKKMVVTASTDYFCSIHIVMKGRVIVEP
ncbi:MAG: plastocyanin, partial [Bacteroidetes bacterium]|nr:plastocyanin [Bacteroidota bacterium]